MYLSHIAKCICLKDKIGGDSVEKPRRWAGGPGPTETLAEEKEEEKEEEEEEEEKARLGAR